ncbi:MAG TPA: GntR family transcriptional regulator [Alphaproteobacteria bacterium]|nr:GntR family transcriptional regulator [Alphaproteobacteria bacterium]
MDRLSAQQPLVDRVYHAILDAICDGELAPGQRVTQDELAARLQVSRQPVLQALLLLRAQGFVRDTGRRGAVIAALDPAFIAHLYELRSALDGAACRGAARRGRADARLWGASLLAAGRAAVASGSVRRMIEADMRFHRFLYELSGNPVIAETAALHWQHIRRAMGGYLRRYRARQSIWDEHAAILDAVVRGDEDEAERLARAHAEAAMANLIRAIEAEDSTAQEPHKRAVTPNRKRSAR